MTRIITIRPEPGATGTVRKAQAGGLTVEAFPLSEISPLDWEGPDPAQVDALLVGSANVFRHGGPGLSAYRDKPVYAVGQTTGAIARGAGFTVANAGRGGLQVLLDELKDQPMKMLRLAGARQVEVDPPQNITIETRVCYQAVDLPVPDALAEALRQDALVMLHSAGSTQHFAAEVDRLGLDRAAIRLAAFGPRIAEAAGDGWADVRAVPQPADGALLALAKEMCQ